MNWTDWYTDTVDIYRVEEAAEGSLTRQERRPVRMGVPCRIYQSDSRAIQMERTAAQVRQDDRLACGLDVDIRAGDELHIHRGARLGKPGPDIRAFAGDANYYYEPFGAVLPGLAHQEVRLMQEERT